MWHEFDWDDTSKLKDHYFYLVTHKKYETPMKAKWHEEGAWEIISSLCNQYDYVEPWDEKFVIAWMELPKCYKEEH